MKALFIVCVCLYCCSAVAYGCCRLVAKFGFFDEETRALLDKISEITLYFVCLPLAIYRRVKRNAD